MDAASHAFCEFLEARRLLSTYTYQVPSGTTAAYIEGNSTNPGQIRIRLNSETASFVTPAPFTNTTGMSIIQAPTGSSGFLFVDKVTAALRPLTDGTDEGIKVEVPSGSGATLRIQAGPQDQKIIVIDSSSTVTTVAVRHHVNNGFETLSRLGEGVINLTLRTNDFPIPSPPTPASSYFPTFSTSGGGTDVVVNHLADDIFLTVDTGAARYNRMWLGLDELDPPTDGYLHEEANVITGGGRCIVTMQGEDGSPLTKARLDFGTRSQIGNNRLDIYLNAVATLAELAGGDHTVVLEKAYLDGWSEAKPATLIVEDESTIDDLEEYDWGRTTVEDTANGTEVPVFYTGLTSSASIEGNSTIGLFTIEGQVDFLDPSTPLTVTESTVTEFDIDAASVPSSNGVVTVGSNTDVTILTSSKIGSFNIPGTGEVTLQARSGDARMLIVKSLSMGSTPTGELDLKDNAMIVDYTGSTPLSSIKALITSAYNAGGSLWTGNGLTSSTAAANATATYKTALGYAEATSLFSFNPTPPTWEGQTLNDTTILVKYTYYGDADLDGNVNLLDYNRLSANFGQSNTVWAQGNFNFDNVTNLTDYNMLAANFGQGGLGPEDGGGDEGYTTDDLLAMLVELYPELF